MVRLSGHLPFVLQKRHGSWSILVVTAGLIVSLGVPASAQIIPDDTLGRESSHITPARLRGQRGDRLEGGAIRGEALFHSFLEFNVAENRAAYFANPAGVEAIFSRVTGTNPSEILGRLGVLGRADLYLLNPNGIMFGPNASLDIRGSFVATTADAFEFADGSSFSATDPEMPPLLTVNVKPGLQYGAPVGANDSNAAASGHSPLPNNARILTSQGNLAVGETLTLAADVLDLTGQLQAGRNLNLRARDTVQIRDTASDPFWAEAGRNLRVRGRRAIDIFALSHPQSGLMAGHNLLLRSRAPVAGDAYFTAGRDFRIERPNGRLGRLTSPNDPVIRSQGDVSFQTYRGASLHIFAGGSVTIPGTITITGPDALSNSVQQSVTLSDGTTVVEIDGSLDPTLDIRAGTEAVGTPGTTGVGIPADVEANSAATSADITLGSISNPGGTVFLTNQYEPDNSLVGGDIRVEGAIDTSDSSTAAIATGGDVVIDARGSIEILGDITTAAETGEVEFFDDEREVIASIAALEDDAQAIAGHITLFSGRNIVTENLNTSALAAAVSESAISPEIGEEAGDAAAVARGGDVTLVATLDASGPVSSSVGNIETGDIGTSSIAVANADADASSFDGISNAGFAIAGNATAQSTGGRISLSTDVVAGAIASESDIAAIATGNLDTGAFASADASAQANVSFAPNLAYAQNVAIAGEATGGTIVGVVGQAGDITLSTQVMTGAITARSDVGAIATGDLNSDAQVLADARSSAQAYSLSSEYSALASNNGGSAGEAIGEIVEDVQGIGGSIDISTQVTSEAIAAAATLGTLDIGAIDASASVLALTRAEADAFARADDPLSDADNTAINSGTAGTATAGIVRDIVGTSGLIEFSTEVVTGAVDVASDLGSIQTTAVDASAYTRADAIAEARAYAYVEPAGTGENSGNGGSATGGTVDNLTSTGGSIAFETQVDIDGDVTANAAIGSIQTETLNSFVDARGLVSGDARTFVRSREAEVSATNSGDGGIATGGAVNDVTSMAGAIALSTEITVGEVETASDIGTLQASDINSAVDDFLFASAEASPAAYTSSFPDVVNSGSGGIATGGTIDTFSGEAGTISISTSVLAGAIADGSSVGTLQTGTLDSSTFNTTLLADASTSEIDGLGENEPIAEESTINGEFTSSDGVIVSDVTVGASDASELAEAIDLDAGVFARASAASASPEEVAIAGTISNITTGGGDISLIILLEEDPSPVPPIAPIPPVVPGVPSPDIPEPPAEPFSEPPVSREDPPSLEAICNASDNDTMGCNALLIEPAVRSFCAVFREEQSAFVVSGRGSLPSSPTDILNNRPFLPSWVSRDLSAESVTSTASPMPTDSVDESRPIVEAQGWLVGQEGMIHLVAASATVEQQSTAPSSTVSCVL